ncbi:MAG TPA: response regulator [Candidatus Dormibacteraeota bacterium]|nr:response regulator [Candidatus Dormibacteraeota bacterium]
MTGPRVVLGEDDVLLREGLASLLDRSGFEVVGLAGDGPRLLTLVREAAPDLVVTDIRMPPTHTTEGLEAARDIRQELPSTAIVVLSAYAEVEQAMEYRLPRWVSAAGTPCSAPGGNPPTAPGLCHPAARAVRR